MVGFTASSAGLAEDPILGSLPDAPTGGKRLGDVILKELLGRGGMGAVYKGMHAVMNIDVAVKVMLPSVAADREQVVQRFVREARLAAQIDHPNVIRVMNVASSGPLHYMVMEYVEGANAEELMRARGRLPEQEAVRIVLDAAAGLKAAYEQCGLRHRDVKPTNLLIRAKDGRVKVSDLGLAKGASDAGAVSGLTMSQTGMGTPPFMSPEQVQSARDVDHRADIYSLGATLYALVTGRAPFDGESAYAVLHKVVTEEPPAPRSIAPDLSEATERAILRSMAKDPAERYQTYDELCTALEPLAGGGATESDMAQTLSLLSASVIEGRLPAGATPPPLPSDPTPRGEAKWWYTSGGERLGPVTTAQLQSLARDGKLRPADMIWKPGMAAWSPASKARNLFPSAGSPPPPPPTSVPAQAPPPGPAAPPRTAGGPRPARATQGGGSDIPAWAKVVGGVVAAIVVLGIVGTMMGAPSGRSRGTSRSVSQSSATMRDLPPPAVDPRLLVGSWGFFYTEGLVRHGMLMDLRPDGSVGLNMMSTDPSGSVLESARMSGYWQVSGTSLWFSKSGVVPEIVNEIVQADGDALTLRDPKTGMIKPLLRR